MTEARPAPGALPAFLNGAKNLFIGGKWVEAASGQTLPVINPSTGEVIARIARGGGEDINRAVAAARTAFEGGWSKWTPTERNRLMLRIHDIVDANFEELAQIESLDMGQPLVRTRMARNWASQIIRYYASHCHAASGEVLPNSLPGNFHTTRVRAPVGVVGGIYAWNGPLMAQWWVLGPTLATGCTAVLKPSEEASLTTLRMAELMQEAGLPEGVINIVTGNGAEAGQALAEHMDVDRLSFTGSVGIGRRIVEASAGNVKRIQLELGGKSPDIIFADADLDKAVPGAAMGVYNNSGQICAAGTRVLVQRKIHDEFLARLDDFTKTIRIGDSLSENVDLGPLISQKQLERVMRYIEIGQSEGARLAIGGERLGGDLERGFFVQPTVFTGVNNDMTIAREEIFGPVMSVIPFDDADEALRIANDTEYGLSGGIWTESLKTAHLAAQGLKAGSVWVNCYNALDPNVGFGGYKMSGYGWKAGREHVDGFLYTKSITMNLN